MSNYDDIWWTQCGAVLLFMLAGLCLFLLALNRVLIHFRDGNLKLTLIACSAILLIIGPAIFRYYFRRPAWLLAPILIIVLVMVGEARRAILRYKHRGAPPVEVNGMTTSLLEPVTTKKLLIKRYELKLPNWKGPIIRIVQVSDLHISNALSIEYFKQALEHVKQLKPDLLLHTGDYVITADLISDLPSLLQNTKGKLGTFGILGNHDYWTNPKQIRTAIRAAGIDYLGNTARRIKVDDKNTLVLSGCEDPWHKDPWTPPEIKEHEILLALSHTPDNIYSLSRAKASIVFAGHYHGGQIKVPIIGSIVIPSIQ